MIIYYERPGNYKLKQISIWIVLYNRKYLSFRRIIQAESFAIAGYLLLIFATPVNLLFVLFFLIFGFVNRSRLKICVKAIGILSINIPIAVLYAAIGLYIFSDGNW
jgi:hypothetical protein